MKKSTQSEPFAARMHVIPRTIRPVQTRVNEALRGYFSSAPGWVLLTTVGRKTGLPREVLLPCTRAHGEIIVISTYGNRSDWIRNLRKNPECKVTRNGKVVSGLAEVIDDVKKKRALMSEHPFVPAAPFEIVNAAATRLMRPLLVARLSSWVTGRPVVVIHT